MVVWDHYDIRRCDANYILIAHVEDLDYDYGGYCRFGCVEKQVES